MAPVITTEALDRFRAVVARRMGPSLRSGPVSRPPGQRRSRTRRWSRTGRLPGSSLCRAQLHACGGAG